MADNTASLQQRLQVLLDAIYDESERQLEQGGDDMKLDHLDYGRMAALIESHTPCPGHEGRADFMNALAEGLCELAYDRWKPAPHLRVAWSAPPIPGGTSHG